MNLALAALGGAVLLWTQAAVPVPVPAPPAPRPVIVSPPPAPRLSEVVRLPLAPKQKVTFGLIWRIVPQPLDTTVLQLHQGQTVTSARLVPLQAWQLTSDLASPEGKTVVPAGTQFVRAVSKVPLACSIRSLKVDPIEGFLLNNERYVCVTDEDMDGRLDHFFFRGESNTGMVAGQERIPERVFDARGGAVRIVPGASATDTPTIELRYATYAFLSRWLLFQPCVRAVGGRCRLLTERLGLRFREVPGTFVALGGLFELMEMNDQGIKVRMVKPFAAATITFDN